jgi:hypothetical protein
VVEKAIAAIAEKAGTPTGWWRNWLGQAIRQNTGTGRRRQNAMSTVFRSTTFGRAPGKNRTFDTRFTKRRASVPQ